MQIVGIKESKPDYTKNWRYEKKHFEIVVSGPIHGMEGLKRAQEIRVDEFSRHELRESHATFQEVSSEIPVLQERANLIV